MLNLDVKSEEDISVDTKTYILVAVEPIFTGLSKK